MDEHSYEAARARFLGSSWKRTRVAVVSLAAVGVFMMQATTTLLLLIQHSGK